MKKKKEKSIKTSFWEKIKNIFNNSPWHAAFTYPILYIFIIPLIGGALVAANMGTANNPGAGDGPLFYIGMFLILSILFTPIWVFAGLFISKKKTPYILSLCIGLGLFALLIYLQIQVIKAL